MTFSEVKDSICDVVDRSKGNDKLEVLAIIGDEYNLEAVVKEADNNSCLLDGLISTIGAIYWKRKKRDNRTIGKYAFVFRVMRRLLKHLKEAVTENE